MRLRVGRTLGRTLYINNGTGNPADDDCIGMVDSPDLAAQISPAVNWHHQINQVADAYLRQHPDQISDDD